MFKNELRKFAGRRYLAVLILLIFSADIILCITSKDETQRPYELMPSFLEKAEQLCEEYNENSAAFEEKALLLREETTKKLMTAEMGDPDALEKYATKEYDHVTPDIYYLDYIEELKGNLDKSRGVSSQLCAQAASEMRKMKEDQISDSDTVYQYEAYVYGRYASLAKEFDDSIAPVYGWDKLFHNSYSVVFLFSVMLILAGSIFLPEGAAGMIPILRASKYGRKRLALIKMLTLVFLSVLFSLLFSAVELLAVYFQTGFSDPGAMLQRLTRFAAFPYKISMLGYLFLTFLFRALSCALFALICALISIVLRHPLLALLGGSAFFLLNRLLLTLPPALYPVPHALNLISLYTFEPLSVRFFGFRIFGGVLPYLFASPFLLFFSIVAAVAAALPLWARSTDRAPSFSGFSKLCRIAKEKAGRLFAACRASVKSTKKKRRVRTHSLFFWEIRKLTAGRAAVFFLLLLIAAQFFLSYTQTKDYAPGPAYRAYNGTYLKTLEGEYTDEKSAFIEEELEKAEELQATKSMIVAGALMLTGREQREFYRAYEEMERKTTARYVLKQQYEYLKTVKESKNIDVWFARYEPLTSLCTSSFSIPLYIALCFFPILLFYIEYSGKSKGERFTIILGTTKYGRKKTFRAKCLVTVLFAVLAAIVFYGIDLLFLLAAYKLPLSSFSAPLVSLVSFSALDCGITIGGFLLVCCAVRILTAALIALCAGELAVLIKNLLPTGFALLAASAFPALLVLFGVGGARYADTLLMLSGFGGLKLSFETNLFGSDFGFFSLFALLFAALTAALVCAARKRFVK